MNNPHGYHLKHITLLVCPLCSRCTNLHYLRVPNLTCCHCGASMASPKPAAIKEQNDESTTEVNHHSHQ